MLEDHLVDVLDVDVVEVPVDCISAWQWIVPSSTDSTPLRQKKTHPCAGHGFQDTLAR